MRAAGIGAVVHADAQQPGTDPIVGGDRVGIHILRLLPAGVRAVGTGIGGSGHLCNVSQELKLALAPLLEIPVDAVRRLGGDSKGIAAALRLQLEHLIAALCQQPVILGIVLLIHLLQADAPLLGQRVGFFPGILRRRAGGLQLVIRQGQHRYGAACRQTRRQRQQHGRQQ